MFQHFFAPQGGRSGWSLYKREAEQEADRTVGWSDFNRSAIFRQMETLMPIFELNSKKSAIFFFFFKENLKNCIYLPFTSKKYSKKEIFGKQTFEFYLKGQSNEILDPHFYLSFTPAWATYQQVKTFSILVSFSPKYSYFSESPRGIISR